MAGYYQLAAPYVHDRQRILDVGCDVGLLLEVARDDGYKELYGLEPVAVAKAEAVKRLPAANIAAHFYEDGLFENDFFDLVSLVHVVDHLVRPERNSLSRVETAPARRYLYRGCSQCRVAAR